MEKMLKKRIASATLAGALVLSQLSLLAIPEKVSAETVNLLTNGDFEIGSTEGWEIWCDQSSAAASVVDWAKEDGNYGLAFQDSSTYSSSNYGGNVTLGQTVSSLSAGSYQLSFDLMGNGSNSFVEILGSEGSSWTSYQGAWGTWQSFTYDVEIEETTDLYVGIKAYVLAGNNSFCIDNISLVKTSVEEVVEPSIFAEEGYSVVVNPTSATVKAGESIEFSARIGLDGTEITDLSTTNAKLWFWPDTWSSGHSDGLTDTAITDNDGDGYDQTVTITFPSVGTYYICTQLQEGKTDLVKEFTTVTVTEAENTGDADDSEKTDDGVVPVDGNVNVTRVPNLSDDFIMGVDISSAIAEFDSGVVYYDYDGNAITNVTDLCKFLASQGITHIRVRVWNNPYDAAGNGYGGGNNDVAKAKQFADACRVAGIKMMVDFHCSDLWTDPGKYQAPKAWKSMGVDAKAVALQAFMTDSLNTIDPSHDVVTMVQVGNETTGGFVGETNKENMCKLFAAGIAGVKAYNSDVKTVIHVTNPEKSNMTSWASTLNTYNVNYDVLATSYYPYWHGTFANLKSQLETVRKTYGKEVMVAETSYAYTLKDSDGHDNTVRKGNNDSGFTQKENFSVQGQVNAIRNVINTVNEAGGIGVFYWEPAWITVGDTTGLEGSALDERIAANKLLWESKGSGWASSYASEYDAKDAGKWFGGSAVDNEAMFYADGKPTEGWRVWNYVKTGAVSDKTDDVVEEEEPEEEPEETITAENLLDASIAGMEDVNAYVASASCVQSNSTTDVKDGKYGIHWWNPTATSETITLKNPLELEAGEYALSIVSQGYEGDLVSLNILSADGKMIASGEPVALTGWNQWMSPKVSFVLTEKTQIKYQFAVQMQDGGWGSADNFYLYKIEKEGTEEVEGDESQETSQPSKETTSTETGDSSTSARAEDNNVDVVVETTPEEKAPIVELPKTVVPKAPAKSANQVTVEEKEEEKTPAAETVTEEKAEAQTAVVEDTGAPLSDSQMTSGAKENNIPVAPIVVGGVAVAGVAAAGVVGATGAASTAGAAGAAGAGKVAGKGIFKIFRKR